MAAIKDYLHLRVVKAHHLPVFSSSSIAFSCFCFSSIFHPEGITRIGNSFKFLNKFLNCQSQTIFWKLYVLLSKNLYLLNDCKEISKFANVVWFFGLISSRLLTRGGKLFYLRKALWYFENFILSLQDLKAHFSIPFLHRFVVDDRQGLHFQQ